MATYQPSSQIETPEPLPRGPLWLLLVFPPLLLLMVNVVIGVSHLRGRYGEGEAFLDALPVLPLALIVCQVCFSRFLRRRYRGSSLVLLSLGYFIGEMVISLAVWFGSCLLFVN